MPVRVTAALLLLWTGCLSPESGDCRRDSDCAGECANTGDCVAAGSTLSLRIEWTVSGATPDATACGPIAELEVAFSGEADSASFRPVPCDLGQITFTRLPPWFDSVQVFAWSALGIMLDRFEAPIAAQDAVMIVDLQP